MTSAGVQVAIGLLAGVLGNAAIGASQSLQKYGIELAARAQRTRFAEPTWLGAMALHVAGEVCGNLLAVATTSPAVVAPLGSLAIVVNGVLSSRLLREPLHPRKQQGFMLIFLGVLLLLWLAPRENVAITRREAGLRARHSVFLAYSAVAAACCAGLLWSVFRRARGRSNINVHAVLAALLGSYTLLGIKILTALMEVDPSNVDLPLLGGLASGIGAIVCLTELIKQRALSLFEASRLFPLIFGAYNFFVVSTSLAFFQQFNATPAVFFVCFAGGVALVQQGVVRVAASPADAPLPTPASQRWFNRLSVALGRLPTNEKS